MTGNDTLMRCFNYYKRHFPEYVDIGRRYDEEILGILQEKEVVSAVDIGCGRDTRLAKYKHQIGKLVGVDVSAAELKYNKNLDEKIVCDAGRKVPLKNNSVDLIVSFFVLEHVSQPFQLFNEVERLLRSGGKFVFLTPNLLYFPNFINRLIPYGAVKKLLLARLAKRSPESLFPVYYHCNTLFAVSKLRKNSQFKSVDLSFIGGPFDFHFYFPLFLLATYYEKLLYNIKAEYLLPNMMIIGEKK